MIGSKLPSNTMVAADSASQQDERSDTATLIEKVLSAKACDIMHIGAKTVLPETSIYEAVRILVTRKITGLPVVDDDETLVGIITEKDILNLISKPNRQAGLVKDHMTTRLTAFDEDDHVVDVLKCLTENHFRRVPILSGGKLVGIVSRADLLWAWTKASQFAANTEQVPSITESEPIRTLMTPGLLTTTPCTPILEAMRIIVTHGITGLPVVDSQMELVGIISEKDLLSTLHDPGIRSCRVGDIMTRDLTTFDADADALDVCKCLANSSFRRLPVVERGKLVGIVSRADLIMFILRNPSVITSGAGS